MRWKIDGADRDDGSDITMVIEAASKADAIAKANARGLLVSAALEGSTASSNPALDIPPPLPQANKAERVPCPNCAELVSPQATLCPYCKHAIFSKNKGANAAIALFGSIALFFIIYYAITAFSQHEGDKEFRRIMDQSEQETDRLTRKAERDTQDMMRRLGN